MNDRNPDHEPYIRRAISVAQRARDGGNHPFGAILVGPAGEVLLESGNAVVTERDCTLHAETRLVSMSSRKYSRDFLRRCILYTSAEPCAMCSGAIYWSGIGGVVYGLSEVSLRRLTGDDPENPTLDLPCRKVFSSGRRIVNVYGPVLEEESAYVHVGFWNKADKKDI